jgi:hypothetical protein
MLTHSLAYGSSTSFSSSFVSTPYFQFGMPSFYAMVQFFTLVGYRTVPLPICSTAVPGFDSPTF